jgi:Cys-tRNA(Pro)/Cys-tRNA(Cys) deacylase
MANIPPVSQALKDRGVEHSLFVHPGPLHSLEQAAQERSQKPGQVVRSIVFRTARDQFVMVLVAGPAQISWPALRQYLGQSRLTMASEAEVLEATGYPLGAVAPFGLPRPMRILVDRSLLQQEIISMGSGIRYTAVILRTQDLLQALDSPEFGDFTSS